MKSYAKLISIKMLSLSQSTHTHNLACLYDQRYSFWFVVFNTFIICQNKNENENNSTTPTIASNHNYHKSAGLEEEVFARATIYQTYKHIKPFGGVLSTESNDLYATL